MRLGYRIAYIKLLLLFSYVYLEGLTDATAKVHTCIHIFKSKAGRIHIFVFCLDSTFTLTKFILHSA